MGHARPAPRGEGGFQHVTSDRVNEGELWDDTLFMTVLPLANIGRILGRQDYIDEAVYQYLVHTKYLADKRPVCGIMVSALMAAITLPRLSGAAATAG